jgi:hypothetical protein
MMHWATVVFAAYTIGFVEFWRMCEAAPLAKEDVDDVVA